MDSSEYVKIGVVVVLFGVAGFLLWRQFGPDNTPAGDAYFYNVDEQELMLMDRDIIPPVDRDGDTVVKAYVYSCSNDRDATFIGYLEKFSEQGKSVREKAWRVPVEQLLRGGALSQEDHLVARPDEMEWHPSESREGQRIKAYPEERCSPEKTVKVQP